MILASVPLAFAQDGTSKIPTDKGTLDVALTIKPFPPDLMKPVMISFEFVEPNTDNPKNHIDYRVTIVQGGQDMHTTYKQHTHSGTDSFSYAFMVEGQFDIKVSLEGIDFNPIPKEVAIFPIIIGQEEKIFIDVGQITAEEEPTQIPDWIKNNAKWWSEGAIGDGDFVNGIQYLIQEGIMQIPKTAQTGEAASEAIPVWIKNTAGYWGNNQISDIEFINTLEWLIENGILKIVYSNPLEIQDPCVLQSDVQSLLPTREQVGDFYRDESYPYERKDSVIVYDGKSYKVFRQMYEKGIRIEISLIKFDSCENALTYLQSEREENSRKGTVEYFEHNVKEVTECVGERWPLKYVHAVMLKCVKDNVYFISSIPRGPANDLSSVIRFAQYVADNFQ